MKRRPRAPTPHAVAWRDGVHVLGTAIWCDARRARAVCFVSAADRTARAGHGQLIATAPTLALLGARADAHLAAPLHRPFSLGTTRLTLLPSGYGPGAAALLIDAGTGRVLYAGAVEPRRADLVPCETLVIAAPYGERHHAFAADAEARGVALCQQIAADRAVAAVLVSNPLRGLAVAERLVAAGLVVAGHRRIVDAAQRLTAAGLAGPAVSRSVARADVLVWPPSARGWRRRWARGRRGRCWPQAWRASASRCGRWASTPRWRGAARPIARACCASSRRAARRRWR